MFHTKMQINNRTKIVDNKENQLDGSLDGAVVALFDEWVLACMRWSQIKNTQTKKAENSTLLVVQYSRIEETRKAPQPRTGEISMSTIRRVRSEHSTGRSEYAIHFDATGNGFPRNRTKLPQTTTKQEASSVDAGLLRRNKFKTGEMTAIVTA